jgi:hypothetical protein
LKINKIALSMWLKTHAKHGKNRDRERIRIERDKALSKNKRGQEKNWCIKRDSRIALYIVIGQVPLDDTCSYEYFENGGEGVMVYILDTGINMSHVEFEGRAS